MSADVLLYDGHCRFCSASAHRLRRAARGAIELSSFREEGVPEAHGLTLQQLERAVHLVRGDGSIDVGVVALAGALRTRWFGFVLAAVRLPVIHFIASALYGLVSRFRFRIAGRTCEGTCGLYR